MLLDIVCDNGFSFSSMDPWYHTIRRENSCGPWYYENLGVQYEVSDDVFHADCDRSEILLKRAYNNLQKVKKI